MLVICLLADFVAAATLFRPVKIATSMFCSTFAFSTCTQLGELGMNQLRAAAAANGAS
jgi:hypothetical protein